MRINIYPFFGNCNMESFVRYAQANGFTVARIDTNMLETVQALSAAQQAAVKDIFKGAAYVEFS